MRPNKVRRRSAKALSGILRRLLCSLIVPCALGFQAPTAFGFDLIVVHGTVAADKRASAKMKNWLPWEIRETEEPNKEGLEEVIVSNACGFAKLTYEVQSISDFLATDRQQAPSVKDFYFLMGEWCRLDEGLIEYQSLLKFRKYQARNYFLSAAPIFRDEMLDPYIADVELIESLELRDKIRQIVHGPNSNGCFDPDDPKLKTLLETKRVREFDSKYCFATGLYLRDMPLNNKLQRMVTE